MNKNEYNAMLHAIWALDMKIRDEKEEQVLAIMKRDRQSLSDIFNRLSTPF